MLIRVGTGTAHATNAKLIHRWAKWAKETIS